MGIGPKSVSDGEGFHIIVADSLQQAVQALGSASVDHDHLCLFLNQAYRALDYWKRRYSNPRKKGERSGLSKEYAERVYQTLDQVWSDYLLMCPPLAKLTREEQISAFQETLRHHIRMRLLQELEDEFVANARVQCNYTVTVERENADHRFSDAIFEPIEKVMIEFFASTVVQLRKL